MGYGPRIDVIDREQGDIRAVLTSDVSSPHLSLGIRVSCMGAANHGHYGYDGNYHWYKHHGHHDRYDNGNDRYHHRHHEHYRHHGHEPNCERIRERVPESDRRYDNGNHEHHHRYDGYLNWDDNRSEHHRNGDQRRYYLD
jgi:hypothetical protein